MKKTVVFIIILLLLAAACMYYNCMLKEKYELEKKEAVATAVQYAIDSLEQREVLDIPPQEEAIHIPPPTHVVEVDKPEPIVVHKEHPDNMLVDERDGQQYEIIHVEGLWWMAENLNYASEGSWCYELDSDNCDDLGRIYTWNEAVSVCPEGWRLPDDSDWNSLIDHYGGVHYAGRHLKEGGYSGFEAKMAGYRDKAGFFGKLNESTYFWSATEKSADYASFKGVYKSVDNVGTYPYTKKDGFSVRCVKNK